MTGLLLTKLGRFCHACCCGAHTLHLKHLEAQNISGLAVEGCVSVAWSIACGCLCRCRLGMLSPMLLDCCCCTHRCGTGKHGQELETSLQACLRDMGVCALVARLLTHLHMGLPIGGVLSSLPKHNMHAHCHTGCKHLCETLGMQ